MSARSRLGAVMALIGIIAGLAVWLVLRPEAASTASRAREAEAEAGVPRFEAAPVSRAVAATRPVGPRAFDPKNDPEPLVDAAEGDPYAGNATIDVRVIWGDDRKPAAGVSVHVVEWGTRSGMWRLFDPVTGEDGRFRLTGVPAGTVGFYVDRCDGKTIEIGAGERKDLTLEIPPGGTVAGVVVGPDGRLVAGAEVWLSAYGNSMQGAVVAKSDEAGAFNLRGVGRGRWIAARSRAFAASDAVGIYDVKPGETRNVRLQLGDAAGWIRGIVTAPYGQPVGGATVQSVDQGVRPPIEVRTDERGGFVLESLAAKKQDVAIRKAGFAPWSGAVEVKGGEEAPLEVRLGRQAAVFGVVKLASGEPASKAFVGVGGYGGFLSSTTTTAADGSFRLDSLAPGTIAIRASLNEVGRIAATLECAEGQEVRWDPVIDAGLQITGVVRDERDQPLAGWRVSTQFPDRPTGSQSRTDSDGRFRLTNIPAGRPLRVEVFDPAWNIRTAVDDVTPGAGDLVIRVTGRDMGSIKGRLVGPDARPGAGTVRIWGGPRSDTRDADASTGTFSFAYVRPGRWRIRVERQPPGTVDLGARDVEAGASVDLGDIGLPGPGRLIVDLEAPPGAADVVEYTIAEKPPALPDETPWPTQAPIQSSHHDLPRPLALGPGTFTLTASGPGLTSRIETFEITAARETRLQVALESRPAR